MNELRWNNAMAQAYARKTDTERECRIAISDAIIHYLYDIGTPRPSRHPLMSVARYLNNSASPPGAQAALRSYPIPPICV